MFISSRTPEGEPAVCPVCEAVVRVEPSLFFSDAPCPSCGCLLWFVRIADQSVLLRPTEAARGRGLARFLSELAGLDESKLKRDPELLSRVELDSVQLVELAMELEDDWLE
jgi:hypothetical protein